MIFDGIMVYAITNELNNKIINAKVEKVTMPNNLELNIYLYKDKKYILKIDCSPDLNRIHLSKYKKSSPLIPPTFCMILRKHLEHSIITKIEQYLLDRIILITFENINELNDKESKTLVIELMGKHSNCILINENKKIIDSLKHITPSTSSVRIVLPNQDYHYPITKNSFINTSKDTFINDITSYEDTNISLGNYLISKYNGFSKMFLNTVLPDYNLSINNINAEDIYTILFTAFIHIKNNEFSYNTNIKYLNFNEQNNMNSLNEIIDEEYEKNINTNIIKNKKSNLSKIVLNNIKKLTKKLNISIEKLKECENIEKYKMYGELITANIYNYKNKESEITVQNYYDNNNNITIPLDKSLTLNINAQKFFKKYSKLKTAYDIEIKNKEIYENEISYLESILYSIDSIDDLEELSNIQIELEKGKYIKTLKKEKKSNISFTDNLLKYTFANFNIIVGKNNIQNDYITHKLANSNDIWLHAQKIPGSHVIIQNPDNSIISDNIIEYAGSLAAFYSKAKNNNKVNIDFCNIKYVKKHPSNKPGMVIYTNFNTIYVSPINS
ncbi:MAG: NFACT RNA binding domain-containing protein [Clostridia bacterium]|nr:NFACT RNA binding domain-containing protein [Clostridia bacterium]